MAEEGQTACRTSCCFVFSQGTRKGDKPNLQSVLAKGMYHGISSQAWNVEVHTTIALLEG